MANHSAISPSKLEFALPIPPPQVYARDGSPQSRPQTPKAGAFISPTATPQGSPSKKQLPPGAHELPNVFENALRLNPTSGNPAQQFWKPQQAPSTPTKSRSPLAEEKFFNEARSSVIQERKHVPLGSPTKENAPPLSPTKGVSNTNYAAASRKELYKSREKVADYTNWAPQSKPLSPEILERLQKPGVKRLAHVAQLYFFDHYIDLLGYVHNRQGRNAQFQEAMPLPPATPEPEYQAALKQYLGRERAYLRKRRTRLRYGDFEILTQVGQGGYGQVYLARKKDTTEVCALKVMSKKLLFKMDEIRHVLTERDILTNAKSDWLVRLFYAFQDERSIYLAMEYVPGGDFRTLLNNTGVLHNRHARFYISEMFCCVDALHQLGYIHRDLKPENFLIDGTGHVKLTDFGLASGMLVPQKIESMRVRLEKVGNTPVPPESGVPMEQRSVRERREGYRSLRARVKDYAKSIVGSPDYMAPEVLQGKPYDFTVDYWSLGCMFFEALAGYPPFAGATTEETWRNLKNWQDVFRKPVYEDPNYFLSKRTWSLITHCINTKDKRFKSLEEIKAHPYFAEVDFERLRSPDDGSGVNETCRPPFVPELEGQTDAGYFDDFESEKDMAKYKEVHEKQKQLEDMADRGEKMKKSLFVGFTFRHRKPGPNAMGAGEKGGSPTKASLLHALEEDAEASELTDTTSFGTMF